MNELVRPLAIALLVGISLIAYLVVLVALFPGRVARVQAAALAMPWRAFALGLVNAGFFGALAVAGFSLAGRAGVLLIPAVLFSAALGIGLSFGFAALAEITGERVFPQATGAGRTARGALVLGLACALPLFGWFLLLVYAGCLGLGAFVVTVFQRN
jgi:hypothetical protein